MNVQMEITKEADKVYITGGWLSAKQLDHAIKVLRMFRRNMTPKPEPKRKGPKNGI